VGVKVETTIDEHETQRLPRDPIIDKLFNAGLLDLSKIAVASHGGKYERIVGLEGGSPEKTASSYTETTSVIL
jgi:hypothetical protein